MSKRRGEDDWDDFEPIDVLPTGPSGRNSNSEQIFADFEASLKSHKKRRRSDFEDDESSDSEDSGKEKHKKHKHRKEKDRHHKDKRKEKEKKKRKTNEDFDDREVHKSAPVREKDAEEAKTEEKQEPKRVIPHDPALDLVNMDWMTSPPPPSSWRVRTSTNSSDSPSSASAAPVKKPNLELNPQLNPESTLLSGNSSGHTSTSHPASRPLSSHHPSRDSYDRPQSAPSGVVGDGGASWSRSTGFDPNLKLNSPSHSQNAQNQRELLQHSSSSASAARWKKEDVRQKEADEIRHVRLAEEENRRREIEEEESRRAKAREAQTTAEGASSAKTFNASELLTLDLNILKSQIMKAKLQKKMGLVAELESKLEEARKVQSGVSVAPSSSSSDSLPSHVRIIDDLDEHGRSRSATSGALTGKLATQTGSNPRTGGLHSASGERLKYFEDDDAVDLDTLVARERLEKRTTQVAGGIGAMDSHYAENVMRKRNYRESDLFERNFDGDGDVDYGQWESREKSMSADKLALREKQRAQASSSRIDKATSNCYYCLKTKKIPAHLIIAMGYHTSVVLPEKGHLIPGHVLIVPHDHIASCTLMEDSIWDEVTKFMRAINNFYETKGHKAAFLETVLDFSPWRHTVVECIPLPKRDASVAPQFFQKAIKESGGEWATHQKIHEFTLPQRTLRTTIPQHFAYFMVQFGMDAGLVHHIEQKAEFEPNFGRQIVGGLLELDEHLYMGHPKRQSYDTEKRLASDFKLGWQQFDWTRDL